MYKLLSCKWRFQSFSWNVKRPVSQNSSSLHNSEATSVRTHLVAGAYGELLDNAEFVHQHVHEAELIEEANQDGEAIWMQ